MSSGIPRLELSDMPAELSHALQPRVTRLGYLGEFFKCAAHQPAALRTFMTLTDDLKAALPDNLTEVVAFTVAGVMQNDYERHQHERLCRTLGFSDEWIRAAATLRDGPLRDTERLVQRLTIAVIAQRGQHVSDEFNAVVAAIGPAGAMAALFLIGRYVTHSLIVNALQLAPPVPSIFEKGAAADICDEP
ncbi:MAG: carboxymuconolactone decarboxylase family protein [Deltaproteobacteria bacterium]|nr:carboxymuconolactone decarboxylase family protein [Deltaproteobacteria bacterium]